MPSTMISSNHSKEQNLVLEVQNVRTVTGVPDQELSSRIRWSGQPVRKIEKIDFTFHFFGVVKNENDMIQCTLIYHSYISVQLCFRFSFFTTNDRNALIPQLFLHLKQWIEGLMEQE
jgi:hypothetical protein